MSTHLTLEPGQRSPCPYHSGMCAYSGHEPDRCPVCHVQWTRQDDVTEHGLHIRAAGIRFEGLPAPPKRKRRP